MRLLEYDEVDPLQVLHFNLLCLDFPLTAELAALIRREDPRVFPFFCLYAAEDGALAGQVGMLRLPVVSTVGAGELGGIWALAVHPEASARDTAGHLLEGAHARMRAAGLRFSTLQTDRYRAFYPLCHRLGYVDVFSSPSAIAERKTLPIDTPLRAEPAGCERLPLADDLHKQLANGYLGLARRHVPFFSFLARRRQISPQNLWLLWKDEVLVGYVTALLSRTVLDVSSLLLSASFDPVAAVVALVQQTNPAYIRMRIDRPAYAQSLAAAGFRLSEAGWATLMVKPLSAEATVDEFRQLYGTTTDRFLISHLDIT